MRNRVRGGALAALPALLVLAACQSSGGAKPEATAPAAEAQAATPAVAADAAAATPAPVALAAAPAATPAAAPAACAKPIAGPPPKPARGADVAQNAIGKNLARNVGRNVLGSALGGGVLGAAVSSQVVRTEQDLNGKWEVTDGSPTCGCEISVSTGSGLTRAGFLNDSYTIKVANSGSMKNVSCSSPLVASFARFGLGHTFTGYDADLEIKDAGGKTVANLKRDGINYFSGTLADGTPVTLWRRM